MLVTMWEIIYSSKVITTFSLQAAHSEAQGGEGRGGSFKHIMDVIYIQIFLPVALACLLELEMKELSSSSSFQLDPMVRYYQRDQQ